MADYGLRLGPLRFVTAMDDIQETLGDQLEQVGAAVVAGERRPRPFNLTIPVRAARTEADPYEVGMRLRRQVRELMENTAWRMQGLPFTWDIDPDLSCWLLVGGGDIAEIDTGLTFGEFKLTLTDCYIAGRPGTHVPGRRLDLADRTTGLVPRTSYGAPYSTDFTYDPVQAWPLVLPGDIHVFSFSPNSGNPSPPGVRINGQWAAKWDPGSDGTVITYRPTTEVPGPDPYLTVPDFGAVRVWRVDGPGLPSTGPAGDLQPDEEYGWERVLGPSTRITSPLVLDNGVCRISWEGPSWGGRLLMQRWIDDRYDDGITFSTGHLLSEDQEWVPIEITPERAVIEIDRKMRIILQRGWSGPRVEYSYMVDQPGGNIPSVGTVSEGGTAAASTVPWIQEIKTAGDVRQALVAKSHAEVLTTTSGIAPDLVGWWMGEAPGEGKNKPMGLQFALGRESGDEASGSPEWLAAVSLLDARSVPVLVER